MRRAGWVAVAAWMCALFATAAAAGETREAVFAIEGLTCQMSAAGLQGRLAGLEGVLGATVDHEAGRATVRFDEGVTAPADLARFIEEAGYAARPVPGATGAEPREETLTDHELQRVVGFVVDRFSQVADPGPVTRDAIEDGTGIAIPATEVSRVQGAVMREVQTNHPELFERLTSRSRCADYGACSLYGDLSGATGDTLALYEREKAEDGARYEDRPLPAFEARNLAGDLVSSAALRGKPTVVTLLAGHCSHSHDSLPILARARERWGDDELRVVAIVINSGSPEDVASWITRLEPAYEVWVHEGDHLGDLLGSHLVPSYFFVDARGRIVEKLVGFKENEVVLDRMAESLAPGGSLDAGKVQTSAAGTR